MGKLVKDMMTPEEHERVKQQNRERIRSPKTFEQKEKFNKHKREKRLLRTVEQKKKDVEYYKAYKIANPDVIKRNNDARKQKPVGAETREHNKQRSKLWYQENKYKFQTEEKRVQNRESKRQWRIDNPEKALEAQRTWAVKNPNKIREYGKRKRSKPETKVKNREYKKTEKAKKTASEYRKRVRPVLSARQKERYNNDPQYRIRMVLSKRTSLALGAAGTKKTLSTLKLLGCTPADFVKHLEKQFQSGMTLDNYGKRGWEIDHIIPCAHFDLMKEEEQRVCFHYSNLRPMWKKENQSKGASVNENDFLHIAKIEGSPYACLL